MVAKKAIKFAEIGLKYGGRASLIGQTGTGKSTLATELVKPFHHVHAFDEKGELFEVSNWKSQGFVQANSIDEYKEKANEQDEDENGNPFFVYPKLIYVPAVNELENLEIYNEFFYTVYQRTHTLCYVDEVYSIVPQGRKMPSYFKAILTRGRSKGITGLFAMQRPYDVPKVVITETGQKYIFRLIDKNDGKRVEEFTKFTNDAIQNLPDFHFFYTDLKRRIEKPLILNL